MSSTHGFCLLLGKRFVPRGWSGFATQSLTWTGDGLGVSAALAQSFAGTGFDGGEETCPQPFTGFGVSCYPTCKSILYGMKGLSYSMKYSAGQAAKATGKSIPTITRAIKNGVISASTKSGGGYEIDPAELHRVFPAVTLVSDATVSELARGTHISPNVLQDKVKMLEEALADARDDRDHWRQQAERLAMALPAPAPSDGSRTGGKRSWWPWGRSND
jgi:hypothetical protein